MPTPLDSQKCSSCVDRWAYKGDLELPKWDGSKETRFICGEKPDLTGNQPCGMQQAHVCKL